MENKYILIIEPEYYVETAIEKLKHFGLIPVLRGCNSKDNLIDIIEGLNREGSKVIALFTKLGIEIDSEVFSAGGGFINWVVTPTTGIDHVNIKEAEKYGVAILSLKGQTELLKKIPSTAELVFGLLFSLLRNIPAAHQDVLNGNWQRSMFLGYELKELNLGILGLGRLGTMVSCYAKAFGMHVYAYDEKDEPFLLPDNRHVIRKESIEELLRVSNVLSLHLPLEDRNIGIIDGYLFKQFKEGAYLINTARGELLDEVALIDALKSGILAGAAVDVLSGDGRWEESVPENNLILNYARKHSNLIITPHIGGYTKDAIMKTRIYMVEQFIDRWKCLN